MKALISCLSNVGVFRCTYLYGTNLPLLYVCLPHSRLATYSHSLAPHLQSWRRQQPKRRLNSSSHSSLSIHSSHLSHRSQVFLILHHHTTLHYTTLHYTSLHIHYSAPHHNTPHHTSYILPHFTYSTVHHTTPHHTTPHYTSYTQNILRHHSLSNLSIIINFKFLHLDMTAEKPLSQIQSCPNVPEH